MHALIVGLTTFFVVRTLRVLPAVRDWDRAGRRPWACDVCMTFWVAGLWTLVLLWPPPFSWRDLVMWPAGAGVALLILDWLGRPPPPEVPS